MSTNYSGDGLVRWYDAEIGGNLVGKGTSILTPPLERSTSFFLDIFEKKNIGRIDLEEGEAQIEEVQEERGLVFNTFTAVSIKTVRVFAKEKGARIISLRDSENQKITERVLLVRNEGDQRVEINLEVPPGRGWRLVLEQGKPFFHTIKGTQFPYKIPDIMEIRESIDPIFNKRHYHYFFDWEVEYDDICGRKELSVEVQPSRNVLEADFDANLVIINADTSSLVEFSDKSFGAVQWLWDFGDGNTSNVQNPEYEYTQEGSYLVSLTVTSEEGCSAVKTQLITVNTVPLSTQQQIELEQSIDLFPNPAKESVQIRFSLRSRQLLRYELLDLWGRKIQSFDAGMVQNGIQSIDTRDLQAGIYFFLFEVDGTRILKKLALIQ